MNLTKLFSRHKWAKNHIISYMAHIIWSIFQIRLAHFKSFILPYSQFLAIACIFKCRHIRNEFSLPNGLNVCSSIFRRIFNDFSWSFFYRQISIFYACLITDKIGIEFDLLFTISFEDIVSLCTCQNFQVQLHQHYQRMVN